MKASAGVASATQTHLEDAPLTGARRAGRRLTFRFDPEDRRMTEGRAVTRMDDLSRHELPSGSATQVAVLTEHKPAVAVIRHILLRMKAWMSHEASAG